MVRVGCLLNTAFLTIGPWKKYKMKDEVSNVNMLTLTLIHSHEESGGG